MTQAQAFKAFLIAFGVVIGVWMIFLYVNTSPYQACVDQGHYNGQEAEANCAGLQGQP